MSNIGSWGYYYRRGFVYKGQLYSIHKPASQPASLQVCWVLTYRDSQHARWQPVFVSQLKLNPKTIPNDYKHSLHSIYTYRLDEVIHPHIILYCIVFCKLVNPYLFHYLELIINFFQSFQGERSPSSVTTPTGLTFFWVWGDFSHLGFHFFFNFLINFYEPKVKWVRLVVIRVYASVFSFFLSLFLPFPF